MILCKISESYSNIKEYDKSKESLLKAESLLSSMQTNKKRQKLQCKIYFDLGRICLDGFKDFKNAQEYLSKAKEYAMDNDDEQRIDKLLEDLKLEEEQSTASSSESGSINQERFQEAKEISSKLREMDKTVTPGSKWHIVSMKWI